MAYGWEGEKIRLVPLDVDKHLENAVLWLNDEEVTRYLIAGEFPITRIGERDWFEQNSKKSPDNVVHAIETLDGIHIGFSGIHDISWMNRFGTTGTLLAKPFWGQGFGTDTVKVRSRYCFEVLNLRLVFSACLQGNTASLKMLKKNGYLEHGRVADKFWKRGEWLDEILLSLTSQRWQEIQTQSQ